MGPGISADGSRDPEPGALRLRARAQAAASLQRLHPRRDRAGGPAAPRRPRRQAGAHHVHRYRGPAQRTARVDSEREPHGLGRGLARGPHARPHRPGLQPLCGAGPACHLGRRLRVGGRARLRARLAGAADGDLLLQPVHLLQRVRRPAERRAGPAAAVHPDHLRQRRSGPHLRRRAGLRGAGESAVAASGRIHLPQEGAFRGAGQQRSQWGHAPRATIRSTSS